ncbi:hypothetical protein GOODEAATRI_028678 [Goodea atripinnis]|uniref:Calx-beta domain-containing protein n=1 Tax=Goodea atripinnis TaxID=208336 RepID=A0ABV0N7B0_9TELE
MHKRYRADKRHGIVVEMEGDLSPKAIDVIMDGKLSDGSSGPGNSSSVTVGILDDDIFEEDEHFFVRLQNLRLEEGGAEGTGTPPKARLVEPLLATVTILDDDHAGIFTFEQQLLRVSENTGMLTVTVLRNSGSRGTVAVPYHTEDGSAKAGVDYQEARGEVEFTNEQTR